MNVIEANHKAFLGNIELKISEVLVTKGDLVLVGELGNLKDKIEWGKFTFVEIGKIIRPYRIIEVLKYVGG